MEARREQKKISLSINYYVDKFIVFILKKETLICIELNLESQLVVQVLLRNGLLNYQIYLYLMNLEIVPIRICKDLICLFRVQSRTNHLGRRIYMLF